MNLLRNEWKNRHKIDIRCPRKNAYNMPHKHFQIAVEVSTNNAAVCIQKTIFANLMKFKCSLDKIRLLGKHEHAVIVMPSYYEAKYLLVHVVIIAV